MEVVPPHDLLAESRLLAALLLDETAIVRVLDLVRPEDFYRENNGVIFRAAVTLFREGDPIDNVTVAAELGKAGVLDRVGGRAHLAWLQEFGVDANVEHTAQIVRDTAVRRRWIAAAAAAGAVEASGDRTEVRVLNCLARLIPAQERERFVAEERGNLGDCEHWWQRVDHLICLALGTPRLAWMMHRENRRGRA